MIKAIYETIDINLANDIEEAFKLKDISKICKGMAALGMCGEDHNIILNYIDQSMISNESWVRKSGIIALYHLNRRFGTQLDKERIIKIINIGICDSDPMVNGDTLDVIEEFKLFNPPLYEKFKLYVA